jgi:membrane protein implicated in regulation of membrane protease activity
MTTFLEGLKFWHWFVLAFVLGLMELLIPGASMIWLAAGAIVIGLLVLVVPVMPWSVQLILFLVASFAAIYCWSRFKRRSPDITDQPALNQRGAQYIGRVYEVVAAIERGQGKIRVADGVWNVKGPDAAAGTRVRVTGVDGTVLVVEKSD